jgi:hypothetical protein
VLILAAEPQVFNGNEGIAQIRRKAVIPSGLPLNNNRMMSGSIMRARNLKPGFFKNEDLAACNPLARILFAGLWCMADREGRLEYRPKRIKAEVLPYDNCNCEELLEQLSHKGFITVYPCGEETFIGINKFTKHQKCHVNEAASTIPACTVLAPCDSDLGTYDSGLLLNASLLNSESLTLNPSLAQSGACTGADEQPVETMISKIGQAMTSAEGIRLRKGTWRDLFEAFWHAYPKKKSRGDAEQAFKVLNPDEQLVETMISKIGRARTSVDWTKERGKYIPYPAKWLRAKGWLDSEVEVDPVLAQFSEKSRNTIRNLQNWRPPNEG